MDRWIIFDGDNTLWKVESLYDDAREELCAFLSTFGIAKEQVRNFQLNKDKELYQYYLYSSCRFPRSFEETAINFLGKDSVREIILCREIAMKVLYTSPIWMDEIDVLLANLRSTHKLALLTAGEKWVQESKINTFEHAPLFDNISIVPIKNVSVINSFCVENGVDVKASWVIGDSLLSDIVPAIEAGLNALWITSPNWDHETQGIRFDELKSSRQLHKVNCLAEIANYLKE